ncbi:Nuclear pore complex protein Nup160 [Manis javanica]|nr:Nuclear pore complex protein Nup160 [Manis javanica]
MERNWRSEEWKEDVGTYLREWKEGCLDGARQLTRVIFSSSCLDEAWRLLGSFWNEVQLSGFLEKYAIYQEVFSYTKQSSCSAFLPDGYTSLLNLKLRSSANEKLF